jgi:hypothetical protein
MNIINITNSSIVRPWFSSPNKKTVDAAPVRNSPFTVSPLLKNQFTFLSHLQLKKPHDQCESFPKPIASYTAFPTITIPFYISFSVNNFTTIHSSDIYSPLVYI